MHSNQLYLLWIKLHADCLQKNDWFLVSEEQKNCWLTTTQPGPWCPGYTFLPTKETKAREIEGCALIILLCEKKAPVEEYGSGQGDYNPGMTSLLFKPLDWEGVPKSLGS